MAIQVNEAFFQSMLDISASVKPKVDALTERWQSLSSEQRTIEARAIAQDLSKYRDVLAAITTLQNYVMEQVNETNKQEELDALCCK